MESMRYEAPETISEALALLANAPRMPRILAGGTDLLIQMRAGVEDPSLILDIKRIPETSMLKIERGRLTLGAAVCGSRLSEMPEFREHFPGLAEATALIGSEQIQGRASVGGNLCNGSPAADTVPSLIVLGASCVIVSPNRTREVPAAEFVTGPGRTVLRQGELLLSLRVPLPEPRTADAYLRLIPRTEMDIAVAGAAISLTLDAEGRCSSARAALGAVAPTAISVQEVAKALVGSTLDDAALEAAAAAASRACSPIDDKRGTVDYRRHVAGVLMKRAVANAGERARGRS